MRCGLRSMELLLAIAERGSIGEAANALELSQPTVSANLRAIENRLKLTLVERSPRGSRLTAAGEAVTGWAREVLGASDRFEMSVAALREEGKSQLRVSASLTIAEYLVPRWLASLQSDAPDVVVALRVCNSEDVAQDVLSGATQLGFVEGLSMPPGLGERVIGHDQLAVVVASSHPWAQRQQPVGLDELLSARLVLRESGSGTREIFDHAVALHGHTAQPAFELGSTAAIKTALQTSDCVAVLSTLAVQAEIDRGQLTPIAVDGLDLRRVLRLIWPAGHRLDGPAANLAQHAIQSPGTLEA